jgi:hypothetical protein
MPADSSKRRKEWLVCDAGIRCPSSRRLALQLSSSNSSLLRDWALLGPINAALQWLQHEWERQQYIWAALTFSCNPAVCSQVREVMCHDQGHSCQHHIGVARSGMYFPDEHQIRVVGSLNLCSVSRTPREQEIRVHVLHTILARQTIAVAFYFLWFRLSCGACV